MSFFREANADYHDALAAKEAARLLKKSVDEDLRLTRLLDPRAQQGGVDHAILEIQTKAREAALLDSKAAAKAEANDMRQSLIAAADAEALNVLNRRAASRATAAQVSAQVAALPFRTTADLNDPKYLSKERPIRDGLDDSRLGPASAQIFTGEDPMARARQLLAQERVREYSSITIAAKAATKAAAKAEAIADAQDANRCAVIADQMNAAGLAHVRERRMIAAAENDMQTKEAAIRREADKAADKVSFSPL